MEKNKVLFIVLFCIVAATLVFPVEYAYAFLVDLDPAGDGNPAYADIVSVSYTNDATYYSFFLGLSAPPSLTQGNVYYVYLETISGQGATNGPNGYLVGSDYYLTWNTAGTVGSLYKWNTVTSVWGLTAAVITVDSTNLSQPNTLILTGLLTDIGYPWTPTTQNMGVMAASSTPGNVKDRAPDTGVYTINYFDVPNLPWLTLPVFILAVIVAVSLLYKYKFQSVKGAYGNSIKVG